MKITKRRIRSLGNYLSGIADGEEFYIAMVNLTDVDELIQLGFSNNLNIGDQVLPNPIGPRSRFNANGGFHVHKDQQKEIALREIDLKDWHGNYHAVTISYLRYPRTRIQAPNIELLIANGHDGTKIIRSPRLVKGQTAESYIIHIVNLFLELFGECDTLRSDFVPVFNVPITRLNWSLLPAGNYPWERLRENVQRAIGNVGENRRHTIERRLETISEHNPNFVAVGSAGFRGYIVFGFENADFFILESIHQGQATYIFGEDWERLSQLTKEEILTNGLHVERVIHRADWRKRIDALFQ